MSRLKSSSSPDKARVVKCTRNKSPLSTHPGINGPRIIALLLLVLMITTSIAACTEQNPSSPPNGEEEALSTATMPAIDIVGGSYPSADSSGTPTTLGGAYPAPEFTASATTAPVEITASADSATGEIFVPVIEASQLTPSATKVATPTALPPENSIAEPTPPAEPSPTPFATVDFAAAQTSLLEQGRELATVKHGFHVTLMEDKTLLEDWMARLDEAGVPFFLKAVNNAEPLYQAQEMMKKSGVPHVLVYRAVGDLPNYNLSPKEAASQHWILHRDQFPPELDPSVVWLETINEPDRLRSEWLAEFALETARLAMADGFRWAAFGWAAGEPEPEHWQSPAMLEFLRLAGENPDRLAIALHEGSGSVEDAAFDYPFRTGRFLKLFEIADQHGIPRPTVLITEWGWAYDDIPPVDEAIADIEWASRLYAPFPEVKGAAIWNLGIGCCFGNVSEQVRELIDPLTEFTLTHYFDRPIPPQKASTDPELYRP